MTMEVMTKSIWTRQLANVDQATTKLTPQILLRALHAALGVTTQKVGKHRLMKSLVFDVDQANMEMSEDKPQKELRVVPVHRESGAAPSAFSFLFSSSFFSFFSFFLFFFGTSAHSPPLPSPPTHP